MRRRLRCRQMEMWAHIGVISEDRHFVGAQDDLAHEKRHHEPTEQSLEFDGVKNVVALGGLE